MNNDLLKVLSPNLGVETGYQILDIRLYACGLEALSPLASWTKIRLKKDKKLLFPPPSMPRQRLCVHNYINTT
jgi:hypothetical protein